MSAHMSARQAFHRAIDQRDMAIARAKAARICGDQAAYDVAIGDRDRWQARVATSFQEISDAYASRKGD